MANTEKPSFGGVVASTVMLARLVQLLKAELSILVTLLGMVTLVKL